MIDFLTPRLIADDNNNVTAAWKIINMRLDVSSADFFIRKRVAISANL